jgi:very-short-patch-repair endonuclease
MYNNSLQAHLKWAHNMSVGKYQELYPGELVSDVEYMKKHREKVLNRDSSYKNKLSELSKNRWKDPEYRKKQIASLTIGQNTKKAKEHHIRGANNYYSKRTKEQRDFSVSQLKKAWKNPEARERRLEVIRRVHKDPLVVERHSKATKKHYQNLTKAQKEKRNKILKDTWAKPKNREKILKLAKIGLKAASTLEVRQKIRETNKTPETKKRRSLAAIKRLSSMPVVSSLNTAFKEALNNAGLFPEQEYPIEFYQVDFCFPDRKIVVEVDGDYWHCNPEIYNVPKNKQQKKVVDKDRREKTYLVNRGWTLIRFWEKDLNRDINSCVNKVLGAVNG